MIKAKNSTSRSYLKILGTVLMVFSIIGLITAIAMFFISAESLNLAEAGLGDIYTSLSKNLDDAGIKNFFAGLMTFSALFALFTAWIIRRAGAKDGKTTLALVLVVLNCISTIYTLFSTGFGNLGTSIYNVLMVTIYVLALMAIVKIRQDANA